KLVWRYAGCSEIPANATADSSTDSDGIVEIIQYLFRDKLQVMFSPRRFNPEE
ncbi:unnamed protein product, partial [Ceratitis capitata]